MRMLLAGAAVLALSACASPEQVAAQQDAICRSYGLEPGGSGYANCRMEMDRQRAQQVNAVIQSMQRQQQDSYDQEMANIRAWGQTYNPIPPPAPRNCITNYIGNSAYTNCQ